MLSSINLPEISTDLPIKKLEFDNMEDSPLYDEEKSFISRIFNEPASNIKTKHLVITKPNIRPIIKNYKAEPSKNKIFDLNEVNARKKFLINDLLKVDSEYENAMNQLKENYESQLKIEKTQLEVIEKSENFEKNEENIKKIESKISGLKFSSTALPVIIEKNEFEPSVDFQPVIHKELSDKRQIPVVEDKSFNPLPLGTKPLALSLLETQMTRLNPENLPPHMVLPVYKSFAEQKPVLKEFTDFVVKPHGFESTVVSEKTSNLGSLTDKPQKNFNILNLESNSRNVSENNTSNPFKNPVEVSKNSQSSFFLKNDYKPKENPSFSMIENPKNDQGISNFGQPYNNPNITSGQNTERGFSNPQSGLLNFSADSSFNPYPIKDRNEGSGLMPINNTLSQNNTFAITNQNSFTSNTVTPNHKFIQSDFSKFNESKNKFSNQPFVPSNNALPNPFVPSNNSLPNPFVPSNNSLPNPFVPSSNSLMKQYTNTQNNPLPNQYSNITQINPLPNQYTNTQNNPFSTPSNQTSQHTNQFTRNPSNLSNLSNPSNASNPSNPFSINQTNPYSLSTQSNPYSVTKQSNTFTSNSLSMPDHNKNLRFQRSSPQAYSNLNPSSFSEFRPMPQNSSYNSASHSSSTRPSNFTLTEYQNIRTSAENPDQSFKLQGEDILRQINSISSNMTQQELSSLSLFISDIFEKSLQRNPDQLKVYFCIQLLQNLKDADDKESQVLKLITNMCNILTTLDKFSLCELVIHEICSLYNVFIPKLYTKEEGISSLQLVDLQRIYQGGELQIVVRTEMLFIKKIGMFYGILNVLLRKTEVLKGFMWKIIDLEVSRYWIPAICGLVITTKETFLSNHQEYSIFSQKIITKLNSVFTFCNPLFFQDQITRIHASLSE